MGAAMGVATLVTISFSHFCEKARWGLDRAGVRYVEEAHMPGFHRLAVRRTGSRRTSVPVFVTDGRAIGDSSEILAYANGVAPTERKLYPEDRRIAAEVEAIEERLDETLGPDLRRAMYFHVLPERSLVISLFSANAPRWQRVALRGVYPLLRRGMERFMKITEQSAAESIDHVRAVCDDLEKRLADGRPYLTGDRFTAADLTLAALAAPAVRPFEHPTRLPALDALPPPLAALVRELQERPLAAFVRRMYREHRAPNPAP
jgi:glutathione S-transferase